MIAEQFSSLLSYHPEYVLIFYECQHAGVSSPPPSAAPVTTGGGNLLPSVAAAKPDGFTDSLRSRHGQKIQPISGTAVS